MVHGKTSSEMRELLAGEYDLPGHCTLVSSPGEAGPGEAESILHH